MAASPDPRELFQAVSERLADAPPTPLPGAEGLEPLPRHLAAILAQARAVAAALNGLLAPGKVDDRNKYDYLLANLDRLATFQSFSLAEYTYHLADGQRPGVRLWLEEHDWQQVVRVLWFPAVGRWQADQQGRLLCRELLLLSLEPSGPAPLPLPELGRCFHSAWGWAHSLTMALCLAAAPSVLEQAFN